MELKRVTASFSINEVIQCAIGDCVTVARNQMNKGKKPKYDVKSAVYKILEDAINREMIRLHPGANFDLVNFITEMAEKELSNPEGE